jgi:hypothetical protein
MRHLDFSPPRLLTEGLLDPSFAVRDKTHGCPLSTMDETMETRKRGRIENLNSWRPGQSGIPGGRPKRDVAAEIARAVFEGNEEAIYEALCKMLLKGNPRVSVALAERAYGKLREPVELSLAEGLAGRLAALRKRKSEAEQESNGGLLVGQSTTNMLHSVSGESLATPKHGAAATCAPTE